MLTMGSSRPWPDVMAAMTGQHELDASALLEYFKPLEDWLVQTNAKLGVPIGWQKSDSATMRFRNSKKTFLRLFGSFFRNRLLNSVRGLRAETFFGSFPNHHFASLHIMEQLISPRWKPKINNDPSEKICLALLMTNFLQVAGRLNGSDLVDKLAAFPKSTEHTYGNDFIKLITVISIFVYFVC
jgi:Angiotensin-converting enzyme